MNEQVIVQHDPHEPLKTGQKEKNWAQHGELIAGRTPRCPKMQDGFLPFMRDRDILPFYRFHKKNSGNCRLFILSGCHIRKPCNHPQ